MADFIKGMVVRTYMNTNPTGIVYDSNHPTSYDTIPMYFLALVIQSAFVPDTKMLSSLLIAKAGLGKTIKLEYLRRFKFVYYTHDITAKNLAHFLELVERGDKKFLVVPDYIATLGHAKKTIDLTRTILRGMIEEGINNIDVYGMEKHFNSKVKAGLISGITPEYFNENTRVWKNDGFLSRFLPFSYSHSPTTTTKIMDNIRDKVKNIDSLKININAKKRLKCPSRTSDIDNQIRLKAYQILDAKEDAPYRAYQQIVALCNSNAVIRNSDKVTQVDVDVVSHLLNFVNRRQVPI